MFDSKKHINNLINNKYYKNLLLLRNDLEIGCDKYFQTLKAPKVDLYLISKSVSSPIALGSDSKPINFRLDNDNYFLADSSQFGMEPLLFNSNKIVYCYLPSFRGEDPDNRHLNQFYHCETELLGDCSKAMDVAEGLIKALIEVVVENTKKSNKLSQIKDSKLLANISKTKFPKITFDEAVLLLENNNLGSLIERKSFGRILTTKAENAITRLVSDNKLPVWVTDYDRDTVAFYQMPNPKDSNKVFNADLIAPQLIKNSFGGEILGLGQRQNKAESILESMKRQKIKNTGQYDWYIKLRKNPKYRTTSGFGLGIERFLTWSLGLENLADVCLYPVLKGSSMQY